MMVMVIPLLDALYLRNYLEMPKIVESPRRVRFNPFSRGSSSPSDDTVLSFSARDPEVRDTRQDDKVLLDILQCLSD